MEKGDVLPLKILPRAGENRPVILIHDPASVHGDNVIEASPFVHSKGQGAVLDFIPKGKFHLVPVFVPGRACLDSLKMPGCALSVQHPLEKPPDLAFLDPELLLIGQGNIYAAPAQPKMRAGAFPLKARAFRNLQQPPFRLSLPHLVHARLHLLSGECVFHHADPVLHRNNSFVWKINSLHRSLYNLPFFHRIPIPPPLSCFSHRKQDVQVSCTS